MVVTTAILQQLQASLALDFLAFLPEILLCIAIVLLLLLRLLPSFDRVHLGWVALVMTLLALGVSWAQWTGSAGFFRAEDHHQDYLVHHPNQPYIAIYDMPKLVHLKAAFPAVWRGDANLAM